MRYIVWHVERSGSNMLMSLLSQTGYAGIADYRNCGYFIGYNPISESEYDKIECRYFENQRTPNGIEACKASLSYLEVIQEFVSWRKAIDWFQSFDKHIVLKRRDVIAQAVSFLFAGMTKEYTSEIQTGKPRPDYDYDRIAYIISEIEGRYCQLESFLELQKVKPLVIYYEDVVDKQLLTMHKILNFLDIRELYSPKDALIQKQVDSLKTEYIERFKRECKSIS